jgi:hypothetical protein
MIIELSGNALNETLHPCQFGDNRVNADQKGHPSVHNDPKVVNFLHMFKFMTANGNAVFKLNGFLISIRRNYILQRSSRSFFQSTTPASGLDHSETWCNLQHGIA